MDVKSFTERVIGNIEKVIIGKRSALELAVAGLLCQGHILIEDVPGVGKTMLDAQPGTFPGLFVQPYPVHTGYVAE